MPTNTTGQEKRVPFRFPHLDPYFDAMVKADKRGAVFDDEVLDAAYSADEEHPLNHDEWTYLSGLDLNKSVVFKFGGMTYYAEFGARARAAKKNKKKPQIEFCVSLPTRHVMSIPDSLGSQTTRNSKTKLETIIWGKRSVVCRTTLEALYEQVPVLTYWGKLFFLTVSPPKDVELRLSESGKRLELRFKNEHTQAVVSFTP